MEQLPVSVEHLGSAIVVGPRGEVDATTTPQLRAALLAALARRPTALVVDLSPVSFLDASCLGTLVSVGRRAGLVDCAFVLAAPSRIVLKLLAITALDQALTIATSIGEALALQQVRGTGRGSSGYRPTVGW